jgi:hypothetical protein
VTRIQNSILQTLCYADIFDYALTQAQLWQFLIGVHCSVAKFQSNLLDLVKTKKIATDGNYYSLYKHRKLIAERKIRSKIAASKIVQARKTAQLLRCIPMVYFIGLSGSLAMDNAVKNDDIDFFIICAPNSLWITRLICVLLLELTGLRRRPQTQVFDNKICLNMFVSFDALRISSAKQDFYTAHEVVQLKPLVNKNSIYERFLYENRWVKKFLPHSRIPQRYNIDIKSLSTVLSKLDQFCMRWQIKYMQKRRTTETITTNLVRFHPKDARTWVMEAYKARLRLIK